MEPKIELKFEDIMREYEEIIRGLQRDNVLLKVELKARMKEGEAIGKVDTTESPR